MTKLPMSSAPAAADLIVERRSEALLGVKLDVVVSGSIGAVESVRFIRALRRLGADVTPWLTAGGAQFITPLALSWAAAKETRTEFSGDASHIAAADAVVIAPASASLVGKIAHGFTDTPASALIASHLGLGHPTLLLANMHESLADSPAVKKNLQALPGLGIGLLGAREEEGKRKFPAPDALADEVAHRLTRGRNPGRVLITMGTTRGYVDAVRYVSNYSSGALGSEIADELYRLGFDTFVVKGPSSVSPRAATQILAVETNDEMTAAIDSVMARGADAAILAASVLDYVPMDKRAGKIASDSPNLTIECRRAPKIIASVAPRAGVKVGFKLETGLDDARVSTLVDRYMGDYSLSLMVLNDLADVGPAKHRAYLVERTDQGRAITPTRTIVDGKRAVAHAIARHVAQRLGQAIAP